MNMQAGSDTCDALDGMTFAHCELAPGHDGLHLGTALGERQQWKKDANARALNESEQVAFAWGHMLPPLGTYVTIGGVDGRNYFNGEHAQLDLTIFSDNGIEAIRVRRDDSLVVIPWSRVDALVWAAP